jgi:hypothetical protein
MKTIGALATSILFLLFLTATPAYPQDREESKPEAKPSQQQEGKEKEKDKAAKPDEGRRSQEQPAGRPEERQENQRRGQPAASRPQEQRPAQETERGHSQHRVQAQRGKRIPDQKFHASFGRQHTFHVQRAQIVNSPQPTIVYGGYSFLFVDPWPVEWAFDDVVFIDFVDDEYFLFDPLYPGIRIALVVVE